MFADLKLTGIPTINKLRYLKLNIRMIVIQWYKGMPIAYVAILIQ